MGRNFRGGREPVAFGVGPQQLFAMKRLWCGNGAIQDLRTAIWGSKCKDQAAGK